MKILFRADASASIGSGHVMRCLVLADQLKQRGHATGFLTSAADPAWLEYISQTRGHPVHAVASAENANETLALLHAEFTHWLVVDHYGLDRTWEQACAAQVGKILAIDDLANRPHACDVLLDYNESHQAGHYQHLVPRDCEFLLGCRHALIKPDFARQPARQTWSLRNILVNFGSYDHRRQTGKVIRASQRADLGTCRLLILSGRDENLRAEIAPLLKPGVIECQGFTDNMAQLLAQTDLAIGAGGTSVYEKCAMGVPTIAITTADNQLEGARALHALGALHWLGEAASVDENDLLACLLEFKNNPPRLQALSDQARRLCDGQGSERVCAFMEQSLLLRPATAVDCDWLHAWRNHEQNRRHSNDTTSIDIHTHRQWFADSLRNPHRHLLIGLLGGVDVAVVRLDKDGARARISIYLKPGLTGQGLGSRTLLETSRWCRKTLPQTTCIEAEIQPANHASLRSFAKAGYKPVGPLFELHLSAY